jgi:hypothetical protein
MKQIDRILRHFKEHRTLTSLEAINEYGNTRLAATVHTLRARGYEISTQNIEVTNRYGEKRHIAKYTYSEPLVYTQTNFFE